jgi:hypothetical protein
MIRKKILFTILIFGLFFSSINFNKVEAKETTSFKNDKVKYTTLEMSDTYSKVKVEYLKTGKIEYLESVLEDGEFVNYVLSSDNKKIHKIEAIEENIYVDGELYGGETSESVEQVNKLAVSPKVTTDIQSEGASTAAITWEYLSTSKGNSSWKYANATLIAGVIATVLGVPAGYAIVLSIAATFAGLELTTVYWKKYHYVDANRTYNTCKRAANSLFYKYSNYTSYIRSSGLIVESVDPCNSPY